MRRVLLARNFVASSSRFTVIQEITRSEVATKASQACGLFSCQFRGTEIQGKVYRLLAYFWVIRTRDHVIFCIFVS